MKENRKISIFELLANLFNGLFHKKNLIILIGRNGVVFSAFNKHELIESVFFKHNIQEQLSDCKNFLKKYQRYQVIILLDMEQCTLSHETLPILNSILKVNPVEKYIEEHYSKSDIIAYNVYNISTENGETWETSIATMPYIHPLKTLLGFIIRNSIKFHGIYFLSLEFKGIIDCLIDRSNKQISKDHFQIFATITKASDIRIAVKHKNNIMAETTAPYPYEKSDLYVQGTIEQIINDKLLMFKDYINGLQLQVSIFILCDSNLKDLFNTMKIDSHNIAPFSANDISYSSKPSDEKFQDNLILEIFNQYKNFRAFNSKLKSITKLTFLNSIIFKPLILLIIVLAMTLIGLRYQTTKIQNDTLSLNTKYYSLSEEYRKIKKNHPEIINVSNLADLYSYEASLKVKYSTPFSIINDLLTLSHPQIEIIRIKWGQVEDLAISYYKGGVNMNIDLEYSGKLDIENGINILNIYINQIKTIFQDYDVTFLIDHKKIIQLPKKLVIPAHITISSKTQEQENVR